MPGGAGNVMRNLTALGAAVAFVSVVGDDQAGSDLTGLIGGQSNVEPWLLVEGGRAHHGQDPLHRPRPAAPARRPGGAQPDLGASRRAPAAHRRGRAGGDGGDRAVGLRQGRAGGRSGTAADCGGARGGRRDRGRSARPRFRRLCRRRHHHPQPPHLARRDRPRRLDRGGRDRGGRSAARGARFRRRADHPWRRRDDPARRQRAAPFRRRGGRGL